MGSSLISEEIIRQNLDKLQAHTYTTGGSRIVAVILSSVWSETHRPLWITIRPRIYTSESAIPYEDIFRAQDVRGSQGTVTPDSTQRPLKPWVDIKPLAKQT